MAELPLTAGAGEGHSVVDHAHPGRPEGSEGGIVDVHLDQDGVIGTEATGPPNDVVGEVDASRGSQGSGLRSLM
jgi:hypothetical protein